jgi:hypothetical protein
VSILANLKSTDPRSGITGSTRRRVKRSIPTFLAALVALALFCPATPAQADVVLTWNEIAVRTFNQQGQNAFTQGRFGAIVQLAVFEAVNAITGAYEPYIGVEAQPGASVDAAAATAAYRVLKTYFPAADIDQAYATTLAAIADGPSKTNGIATGEAAAAALIANRQNDGSSPAAVSPVGLPLAGVWQLTLPPGCAATATGGVFYHWQNLRPFGVPDPTAFRAAPPPSFTSAEFTRDYNEVKRVGAVNSPKRPENRSDVARFYHASSPTLIFNLAARQVAAMQRRSISHNARSLALINMAINDSLIASFGSKYHYNYWRPETSIRFLGDYGNTNTTPDQTFVPYISTPCFPSYPSNHASASTGGAEMLRLIYGGGPHYITMSNPYNATVANLSMRYLTVGKILDDVDDARVYGGVHFRFDQTAGRKLGSAVARYVYANNLKRAN